MKRLTTPKLFALLFGLLTVTCCGAVYAADTSTLGKLPDGDWAISWLGFIFRGTPLPDGFTTDIPALTKITAALREALSLYGVGMLVLGGFLIMYHVASMIAETAHHGTVMGRRANQLWTPIRFVLAIGLLVPIGGGLSSGQYLIVKLAEQGSSLASNAWSKTATTIKGSFSTLAPQQTPDIASLVTTATEMELCRSLYRQLYTSLQNDPIAHILGDIGSLQQTPAQRLAPETWRYSNLLQSETPLCGEYRFLDSKIGAGDDVSHASVERLTLRARMIAEATGATFLSDTSSETKIANGGFESFINEQRQLFAAKLQSINTSNGPVIDQNLDSLSGAGWIAAGNFLADLTRLQSIKKEQSSWVTPQAQNPLFGHNKPVRETLDAVIATTPALHGLSAAQMERLTSFYDQMNRAMKRARNWLYSQPITNAGPVLPDRFELQDQLSPANDVPSIFFIFGNLLNAASATYGVWSRTPQTTANNSFLHDLTGNPLIMLGELGQRYLDLGSYLTGMTGTAMAESGAASIAILFGIIGGSFSLCGLMLLFLLPLLPLFRFFFGVLAWVLAVFEAVITLPLVALAHINPVGEGLSGSTARHAYWLWLGVFMRPVLTLFGFVMGLVVLAFGIGFLNILFSHLMDAMVTTTSTMFTSIRVAFAFLYAIAALAVTNFAFKGITLLPDSVLQWLGNALTIEPIMNRPAVASAQHISISGAPMLSAHGNGSSSRERSTRDRAASTSATPNSLKSALFPSYREAPPGPVDTAGASGKASGSMSSSSASAAGGTATASAEAIAIAIARHLPAQEKPVSLDTIKSAVDSALLLRKNSDKTDKASENSTEDTEPK